MLSPSAASAAEDQRLNFHMSATNPSRQWANALDHDHASVSTHDMLLGGHADLDASTDGGSTIGGSCFQSAFPRLADDPKSPGVQNCSELSHFQTSLFNDQVGSMLREVNKLKQEVAAIRTEADGLNAAREKGDAEVMKMVLDMKQSIATQMDPLDREVKLIKRKQAEDMDDWKASAQQSQLTVESELRRLCVAVDGSTRHADMLGASLDKEVQDRTEAAEALSTRLDLEVQKQSVALQEQNDLQSSLLSKLQEQLQFQSEFIERTREDFERSLAAALSDLRQEAEQQSSTLTALITKAVQNEANDRAEQLAQFARQAAESLQHEHRERCSGTDAMRASLASLAASMDASRAEDRQSIASTTDALQRSLSQEIKELRDAQKAGSTLHENLVQRGELASKGLTDLQHSLSEHKALAEAKHRAIDDHLRENAANIVATQAAINSRLSEEQAIREQNTNAFRSSLEAVDVKYQGKIVQLTSDQTAHKAELRDLVNEHKRHLETQQENMKDLMSYDKVSREKEMNALRDSLHVQLREESLRMREDAQTGHATARDLINRVAAECQASQTKLRDALAEQKSSYDVQQGVVQGSLAEETAAREQTTKGLQATITALDTKLTEGLMKLSAAQDSTVAPINDLLGRHGQQLEQQAATVHGLLHEERRLRDESMIQVRSTFETGIAKLKEEVAGVEAGTTTVVQELKRVQAEQLRLEGVLADERRDRERAEVALKEGCDERLRNEGAKLGQTSAESHSALRDLIQKSSAEQHALLDVLQSGFREHKQGTEAGLETLRSKVSEEASLREAASRDLHSSVLSRFEGLSDELRKDTAHAAAQQMAEVAGLRQHVDATVADVAGQVAALTGQATAERGTVQQSLTSCQSAIKEELAKLAADQQKRLEACEALVAQKAETEAGLRHSAVAAAVAALEAKFVEKLTQELQLHAQERESGYSGIHSMLQQQVADIHSQLAKEKEDRERVRCGLQVSFEELDTRVREDLDRMAADTCSIQEMVRGSSHSAEQQVSTLRTTIAEMQSGMDENRSAVQAMSLCLSERLKESNASLGDQVEKDRMAIEAGLGSIREVWGQMEQKLHSMRMEMRDAMQELEQKSHAVRLEEQDRVEQLDQKLQEEIDGVAAEQRASHSLLHGQLTELQGNVETLQTHTSAQLQEERTLRDSMATRMQDRCDKLDARLTTSLEQETSEREESAGQLRQQIQQRESMQRDELKCELKGEITKLWDAVNNHTHDVNAMTTHKVTTNKQSQESHNNVQAKGMHGVGFRSVSPGPAHSYAPSMHALADVHQHAATPVVPAPPLQGSRAIAIEGPVQRSSSGPLHTVKVITHDPQPVGHAGRSVSAAKTPRQPYTPVAAAPYPSVVAPQPTTPRSSVSVLPPPASTPTSYVPHLFSSPTEAGKAGTRPTLTAVERVSPGGYATQTMGHHHHDRSNMMFQSENVETSEELHKLSCGPAQFGDHNTSSASIRS